MVENRSQRADFVSVPALVNATDPQWRPTLRRTASAGMRESDPFHAEAEIAHFVAYRGQRAVGRIAATIDREYVGRYGEYGLFGFFDCVPDIDVARALTNAAERWACERGMTKLSGPYNYSPRHEMGLLIHGFDLPPALMQPHNPAYYADLLQACGFERRFDTATYRWDRGVDAEQVERVRTRARKVLRSGRIRVRKPDMRNFGAEVELLRRIYNRSFRDHPEHVPISAPVFGALAADLRFVLDPELIRIVEVDGEPSGFAMLVPDLKQITPRSGRLTPALLVRLIAKRDDRIRGIDTAVVVMIGVVPEHAGLGVGRVVAGEIAEVVLSGRYRQVATTWIHERNHWSTALVAQMKAAPVKRYRIYEKAIA